VAPQINTYWSPRAVLDFHRVLHNKSVKQNSAQNKVHCHDEIIYAGVKFLYFIYKFMQTADFATSNWGSAGPFGLWPICSELDFIYLELSEQAD